MRLGFACHWGRVPEQTWSGTPWRLREALRQRVDVVDVGVDVARIARPVLRAAALRPTPTGWRSQWHHTAAAVALMEQDLRHRTRAARPDVVLEIQDLGAVGAPFMLFQDLSYELLVDRFGDRPPHFPAVSARRFDRLRRRQGMLYEQAAALLPLSRWLAEGLVRHGIDPGRVHVVNPGINVPGMSPNHLPERRTGPVRSLLMVGRDFERKGGVQLISAFAILRRELGTRITLTVAGPSRWPLRGDVPEGVTFLGPRSPAQVGVLMDQHDLFVMPSLFEAFGIVFAEALARGLPCIGRDDCAMPEIIDPVSGGRLVRSERPDELAGLIVATLADDALYRECQQQARGRWRHYSWDRAAREVVQVANQL